jgi:thiol-disulfide isomerase/thioredoxin
MVIAKDRGNELASCKNVSDQFRILETGRIKADIINSLDALKSYYRDIVLNKDSAIVFRSVYDKKGIPLMKEYASDFYDSRFLKLEVYRDILEVINESSPLASVKASRQYKQIKDWENANKISFKIKSTAKKDSIRSLRHAIDRITTLSYKTLLINSCNSRLAFGNGDPAKNFIAKNGKNEEVSLSEFKGKVICLDVWATWCGPCLYEIPYFDKLKEKYKDNPDIVFVSLSIDTDIKEWKGDLASRNMTGNQWVINRLGLGDYSVAAVPRTIIIDKYFNVHDMDAPRPSSGKTENIIERLLK